MERSSGARLLAGLFAIQALSGCSSTTAAADAEADGGSDATTADATSAGDDSSTSGDSSAPTDAPLSSDADATPLDAATNDDAGEGGDSDVCEWGGAPGTCTTLTACSALGDHSSYPNECPGPSSIQCCIVTPDPANNPPVPVGWVLMQQADVTPDMTTWAVMILNEPQTYPMFATTTMTFGALLVLARVEWHPPDSQNMVIHRGVTLYERAD